MDVVRRGCTRRVEVWELREACTRTGGLDARPESSTALSRLRVQSTKVRGKMPMGRHACGCLAGRERSANRSRKDREEGQRIDDREGVPVSNEYVNNERLSYDARLPSASTRRPPTAPFLALFAAVTVTPPPSRERVLNMASLTHCSFFSLADTGAAFGF